MSRRLTLLALAVAAVGLSGCITVFPKETPSQLYRFDMAPTAPAATDGPPLTFFRIPTGFPRAAATDRILTVSPGGEAAYIAGARWISPATVLFDEQVTKAFLTVDRIRPISRGEVARADYAIRLDVVNFETRYDQGAKAAPTVVVAVRCLISRSSDRKLLEDRLFTANVRASENRVGAIVPAYNKALSDVMTQVLALANTMGPPDQAQPSPSTVGRNG